MPTASGASNVRITAPSSFGSLRCSPSLSTERLSQRTNVCSQIAWTAALAGSLAGQSQLVRVRRQRVDHELHVLVEAETGRGLELLGASIDVVAVDAGCE